MHKNLPALLVITLLPCWAEVDISVPSFPGMAAYFEASDSLIQTTITVNFLGFCISTLLYGPLSDVFGRRKVMLIGNAIMLLGAFGCVFSPSIEFLLFARFVQGLGASTSTILVFSIITDKYCQEESAKIISSINAVTTIFISFSKVSMVL